MTIIIYHNPRCRSSRNTLILLTEQGIEPEVRLYLDEPLSKVELIDVLSKLGMDAVDLLRTKEAIYLELVAEYGKPDNETALNWMVAHPILMQRPIVVKGDKARLGRPPMDVLDIL